jgi:uncharacterized integral membrane protein
MARAIVSAVLLVLLAVLVAFNVRFTTSFSLFGARFDDVPTMALALVSFAVGVVYSFFLYVSRFLQRRKRQGLAKKDKALTRRERELAARESAAHPAPDLHGEVDTAGPTSVEDGKRQSAPGQKRPRFFSRFKAKR